MNLANTKLLDFYTPAGYQQVVIGMSHPALEPGPPPKNLSSASPHKTETLDSMTWSRFPQSTLETVYLLHRRSKPRKLAPLFHFIRNVNQRQYTGSSLPFLNFGQFWPQASKPATGLI